jgi:hypothetical protein
VFSFDEILYHGDKNEINVIHAKVLFEKNDWKSLDFEDLFLEIVRCR